MEAGGLQLRCQLRLGRQGLIQIGEQGEQAGPRTAHRHRQGALEAAQQGQAFSHAGHLGLHHGLEVVAQGRQAAPLGQGPHQGALTQGLAALLEFRFRVEIEVVAQLTAAAVGPGGADAGIGVLEQQHRQRRRRSRQRLQPLAPAEAELGAAGQAVGHVRTELGGQHLQLGRAVAQAPERVEAKQRGGAIAGAPRQAGADGDALAQVDLGAQFRQAGAGAKQLGRPHDQVAAIGGQVGMVAVQGDAAIGRGRQAQHVHQLDGLHHHRQLMEAIGPQAEHLQVQVDLGRGADAELSHRWPGRRGSCDSSPPPGPPRRRGPAPGAAAPG